LGVSSSTYDPQVALSQPKKPLISYCFCQVHLQHPLLQKGKKIVHYIRFFQPGDEVASFVFGQAFARGPGFP
jgi:hypothetical protein